MQTHEKFKLRYLFLLFVLVLAAIALNLLSKRESRVTSNGSNQPLIPEAKADDGSIGVTCGCAGGCTF